MCRPGADSQSRSQEVASPKRGEKAVPTLYPVQERLQRVSVVRHTRIRGNPRVTSGNGCGKPVKPVDQENANVLDDVDLDTSEWCDPAHEKLDSPCVIGTIPGFWGPSRMLPWAEGLSIHETRSSEGRPGQGPGSCPTLRISFHPRVRDLDEGIVVADCGQFSHSQPDRHGVAGGWMRLYPGS